MRRIIPAYQKAAERGQIELSTTPYYHPILPLLANTDSARVGAGDTVLPHRRFAHPQDAWEQVRNGIARHEQVFGARTQGMWCSEQSVGEDVLPLLMRAGMRWTVSDETVLARSVAGSAAAVAERPSEASPYLPYLLRREEGELAIVFRDHTLSDLIGFGYQSWDSRDAAQDLLSRIRAVGAAAAEDPRRHPAAVGPPLVVIALDGENAWEYYPHDGRDFLHHLYQGLSADPGIRCVTISEHLAEHPAVTPLDWLHTGSWIGGDLRTWSGDPGHNAAWDLLHDARDHVRQIVHSPFDDLPRDDIDWG
jgi:alpha-amylase/alpha-mannosidase (GH57 family)